MGSQGQVGLSGGGSSERGSERGEGVVSEEGRGLEMGGVSGVEGAQRGRVQGWRGFIGAGLREVGSQGRRGLRGAGGAHTPLDELQGLLPLLQAELIPLFCVVQVVHRDDRGCHADHVLLPTARGGLDEVLQPLPVDGVLCQLGHWGPCSQA